MKTPQPFAWAAVAWGAVIAYAIYQGGALAWHLLGFVIVLSLMVAVFHLRSLSSIAVQRHMRPGPYGAGESLTVSLTVSARHAWLWPYLLVIDQLPAALDVGEPRFVLSYLGKKPLTLHYQIPALQRGIYEFTEVSLTTGDLFGLSQRSRQIALKTTLIVWPKTVSLDTSRLTPRLWHGENRSPRPTRDESIHIRGIREYVQGDRLSRIHWKKSAHTGDLKVKQFEPETQPEFTVLLDGASQFTRDNWEVAISTAASLVAHAHHAHQTIGLESLDFPREAFLLAQGAPSLQSMMNFLSGLTYRPTRSSSPFGHLTSSSPLVVITSPAHADRWRERAALIVVIGSGGVQTLEDLPGYLDPLPQPRGNHL